MKRLRRAMREQDPVPWRPGLQAALWTVMAAIGLAGLLMGLWQVGLILMGMGVFLPRVTPGTRA